MDTENQPQTPGRDDPPDHKPTGYPEDGEGRPRKPDTSDSDAASDTTNEG
jgi:hypothetical protein